ncbi:MAG: bleomycin resistance protein [Flavobacteriia bacterium]|jgi:catechol 2,3-dioxygenase-like lactoylglutathione lyase family enzyme
MLLSVHPKLPMRNKSKTRDFYVQHLGFQDISVHDYDGYLILKRDEVEIHFFEHKSLNPKENYGQVYIRVHDIETFYQELIQKNAPIHPNGHLHITAWGQKEFSMLDSDFNLLTFGEEI